MPTKPGSFYKQAYGSRSPGSFYQTTYKQKKPDLSTPEGLYQVAQKAGFGNEADEIISKTKKPSVLTRLLDLLSRGTYASANIVKEITDKERSSPGDVIKAGWRGLKGEDKTTYSQVLDQAGVKNKFVKAVGGFAGDVLLDPTTYVGGSLVKGAFKGVKGAANMATKLPVVGKGVQLAGEVAKGAIAPIKEAAGRAFVYGYGTTAGLTDDVTRVRTGLAKAKEGIAKSALKRYKDVTPGDESKAFQALTETRVQELADRPARYQAAQLAKGTVQTTQTGQEILTKTTTNPRFAEAEARVLAEVENAHAGQRFFTEDGVIGQKSSFPTYVPDDLRSRKLFDKVQGHILAGTQPKTKRLRELYNVLQSETEKRAGGTRSFQAIDDVIPVEDVPNAADLDFAFRKYNDLAVERAKSLGASEATLKTMQNQFTRNQKFAKLAGVEQPYEAYFPFIKAENLKQVEQATSSLKVGSQGYLKQFQAKLKPEEIINSVPEAYARREYQIVRDKITKDSLDGFVKKYGKQFENADDALREGFVPLKEKGQFGKVVGYLKQTDKKFIDQVINPEFETIDKLAKATGYDTFNKVWKTAVTRYFPAFYARNWMSGVVQNYEVIGKDAFSPRVYGSATTVLRKMGGKEASNTIKFGDKIYKTSVLAKKFEARFGRGDWRHIADIGDVITEGRASLKLSDYASKGLSKINKPFDKAGEFVETQQKMVAFIGSLKQQKTIDEALNLAEKAGFDYSKVTPFEAKVLRRIIPFYTFTRKNLELQGKVLASNPERIANIAKGANAISTAVGGEKPSQEDLANLPDYVRQQLLFKGSLTGKKTDEYGRPLFTTAGGTALEAAAQQLSGNIPMRLASQINPILKYVFEGATGIDTFRSAGGDKTEIKDVINADKYASMPVPIKRFLKLRKERANVYVNGKIVGQRDAYKADPERLRILNFLPTSRFVNTAGTLFDDSKPNSQKALDLLTGFKTYAADEDTQQYFNDKKNMEDLVNLLEREGLIKRFERAYIPKK